MDITVLYEDDDVLVIDKPPGVIVNRADTVKGETIQDWVKSKMTNGEFRMTNGHSTFLSRSGIVHRLDKETSGCLIVAKTPDAFDELQRQFRAREVRKEYLALVHGAVEPDAGTIRVPLARSRANRRKFAVTPGGRISETGYAVSQIFKRSALNAQNRISSEFTLLRLFPKTGRTHQIRVHLQYFGHPIAADEKYGGKRALADRRWCPRLFLHAESIHFTHPTSHKLVRISSPLPDDLALIL